MSEQSGIHQSDRNLAIPVMDDGNDYFYFVRTVWEHGFVINAFRLNGGVHPDIGEWEDEPVYEPEPAPVWVVQPTIYLSEVRQCNCGQFVNSDWNTIDPETGLVLSDHLGHGGSDPGFVYDRARELFGHPGYGIGYRDMYGMHSVEEFFAILHNNYAAFDWWHSPTEGFLVIQSVDSSLRNYYSFDDTSEPYWYLPQEAFLGRFAFMNNGEFVTDFIFEGVRHRYASWEQLRTSDIVSVNMGGRWGLVDRTGANLIPFMFENLVIIDENTAFARYNGRYGILNLPRTIENMR